MAAQAEDILVGDLVAEFLQQIGVTSTFGVISIHNIPMLDAIGRRNAIRFVMARGEAGGGHMADAYARVSGELGVLFTSTGAVSSTGVIVRLKVSPATALPWPSSTSKVKLSAVVFVPSWT